MEVSDNRVDIGFCVSTRDYGGAEYYLELLAGECRKRGLHSSVIGKFESQTQTGFEYVPLNIGPKWSRSTLFRSIVRLLSERALYMQTLSSRRPRIVHLQFKREQILLSKSASKFSRVVWTEHGVFPEGLFGAVLSFFYRRASQNVHHIICVSDAVAESLIVRVGVTPSIVSIVPNGIDTQKWAPDPIKRVAAREVWSESDRLVLTLSRLESRKGLDRAIRAMDYLPDCYRLIIAGDGPANAELRELAEPLGQRVIFAGFTVDVEPLIRAADVFLFPSRASAREGTPMSVLQALAGGLPIVITADAGIDRLVADACARVAGKAPASIADAIDDAYRNRSMLVESSTAAASKHSLKQWADASLEILTDSAVL